MGRRLIKAHPQVKPEVTCMSSSSDLGSACDGKHSCRLWAVLIPPGEGGIISPAASSANLASRPDGVRLRAGQSN